MRNVLISLVDVIGSPPARRRRLSVALAAILCAWANSPAAAAGNVPAGRDLAQRWCSSCHIVDQSGHGPDTAPPFRTIAKRGPKDRDWMRAWITAPHPPMPNLNLSRQQIDDVVAYIDSLTAH